MRVGAQTETYTYRFPATQRIVSGLRAPAPSSRVVDRAVELIASSPDAPLTVADRLRSPA